MSDMDDHAYAYQANLYQENAYQGAYQDGGYQNEASSDPAMPQTDEMEGDAVDEPRKQKVQRREPDEDDEDEDEGDDDEDDEEDEEDSGRKKKRTKVCSTHTYVCVRLKNRTFTPSIATSGPLPVVSSILKPRSATKMRMRRMKMTLEEVGYF